MTARRAAQLARHAFDWAARRALEPAGYHLTRRHFYSPIPVVDALPRGLWDRPSALAGLDLGLAAAVALLEGPLSGYLAEFRPPLGRTEPGRFWLRNGSYESVDAELLYAMVRHFRPERVYELGSGASSHVIGAAAAANRSAGHPVEHTVFDPFPFAASPLGPAAGAAVRCARTEDLDATEFDALRADDILFVDTTHTVRTGGDVTHIVLDILPRLAAGVVVHFHDVFLPYEYPREWVIGRRVAWAEQYILQAFLAFNDAFEVLMPNYAVARAAPETVRRLIGSFDPERVRPGGFWIRRRSDP